MRLTGSGDAATAGWTFDNGRDFPGTTGQLAADPDGPPSRGGAAGGSMKLVGDFTKGGAYVQAGRKIDPPVDVRELSAWVRNPDADKFTLRLTDGTGQTHQIDLHTQPGPDWQRVVLPLEQFFAKRGQADAVAGVAKYRRPFMGLQQPPSCPSLSIGDGSGARHTAHQTAGLLVRRRFRW